MKKHISNILLVILSFTVIPNIKAQTNNWSKLDSIKNYARIYGGLDYGVAYGIQYGRIIKTKSIVWIPFVDLSFPLGNDLGDDYRFKVGTTAKLFEYKSWIASVDISIVNRQNRNPFVKLQSFGYESGLQIGYYKHRWFTNIHFSTDNALTTHFKHSEAYNGNYSGVKDGWYQNTANNQLLGFNTGYSLKKIDITLSSGLLRTDEFKSKPSLPLNIKIGVNCRF